MADKSEWRAWLLENKRSNKGGIRLNAARRGLQHKLIFNLPASFVGATLRGQVRLSPDAATAIATYTIPAPVVSGDYAVFTATLAAGSGANSTGALPADADIDGLVVVLVDFLLTPSGGTEELLLAAELPLTGFITGAPA